MRVCSVLKSQRPHFRDAGKVGSLSCSICDKKSLVSRLSEIIFIHTLGLTIDSVFFSHPSHYLLVIATSSSLEPLRNRDCRMENDVQGISDEVRSIQWLAPSALRMPLLQLTSTPSITSDVPGLAEMHPLEEGNWTKPVEWNLPRPFL